MKKNGFNQSRIDPCIFYKVQNEQRTYIAIYVDDFLIVSNSVQSTKEIVDNLKKEYSINMNYGTQHDYLGMALHFNQIDNTVSIMIPNYIEDILNENMIKTSSPSPASVNLFRTDKNAPTLNPDEKERFHTTTAQLLYLSKRTRPDIQLAVSFLTTRVDSPTLDDSQKLQKVVKYLKGTKDLPLVLRSSGGKISLSIYVDSVIPTCAPTQDHS